MNNVLTCLIVEEERGVTITREVKYLELFAKPLLSDDGQSLQWTVMLPDHSTTVVRTRFFGDYRMRRAANPAATERHLKNFAFKISLGKVVLVGVIEDTLIPCYTEELRAQATA